MTSTDQIVAVKIRGDEVSLRDFLCELKSTDNLGFLDDGVANTGVLRAVSGSSNWAGPIRLVGDSVENRVLIGAFGTNTLQNDVAAARLNITGVISDLTPGSNPTLVKIGQGDVVLSGANTYGGLTLLQEGALVVHNAQALGSASQKLALLAGRGSMRIRRSAAMSSAPPAPFASSLRAASSRSTSVQGVATKSKATIGSASAVAPGTRRTLIIGTNGAGLSRRARRNASGR